MTMILKAWVVLGLTLVSLQTGAAEKPAVDTYDKPSFLDEFDPAAPGAEALLEEYDRLYEEQTGQSPFINGGELPDFLPFATTCKHYQCPVFLHIQKSNQTATLYVNGRREGQWAVSTGLGNSTPNMSRHPNGRVYNAYTSKAYPGGDYNGLGNMPYAVFIKGGYAVHGTPRSNWPLLGQKASHGCIRLHPDHAYYFNQLVRAYGVRKVWITVDNSGELMP